jgi:hypothetical protein
MAEASSEIQQVLRQSMADLVAHMAERLKDGADGKPLKFKQSTVSNLVEFLSNFSFRNVTDDRQLQGLVGRARELLQGVAADDLRTNQRTSGAGATGNGHSRDGPRRHVGVSKNWLRWAGGRN